MYYTNVCFPTIHGRFVQFDLDWSQEWFSERGEEAQACDIKM